MDASIIAIGVAVVADVLIRCFTSPRLGRFENVTLEAQVGCEGNKNPSLTSQHKELEKKISEQLGCENWDTPSITAQLGCGGWDTPSLKAQHDMLYEQTDIICRGISDILKESQAIKNRMGYLENALNKSNAEKLRLKEDISQLKVEVQELKKLGEALAKQKKIEIAA